MEAVEVISMCDTDLSRQARTVILPLLSNLAQFGYPIELSIEIQNVLAVEALARLDEVQVCLLEFADFDDMVLGALELLNS